MLHILIISSRFYPQLVGSGTSAFLMAEDLVKQGHRVTVLTDESVQLAAKSAPYDFEVGYIKDLESYCTSKGSAKKPTEQIYQAIKNLNPDIIQVINFMPMLIISTLKYLIKVPIVFTFFNTPDENRRAIGYYDNPELDLALAQTIVKLNAYEALFLGSQTYVEMARRLGAQTDKITFTPLGVDFSMPERNVGIGEVFADINNKLHKNDKLVTLPGRLVRQKGITEAVEALSCLGNNVKLLLTGMALPFDQTFANYILDLAKKRGVLSRIIIPKQIIPRENLKSILMKSEVIITPSYYEGLGMSAIEALGLGRPLVATRVPGLSEFLIDGFNSVVVPPKNSQALAEGINTLLTNNILRKKIMSNALMITEKYSIKVNTKAAIKLYMSLIKEKK